MDGTLAAQGRFALGRKSRRYDPFIIATPAQSWNRRPAPSFALFPLLPIAFCRRLVIPISGLFQPHWALVFVVRSPLPLDPTANRTSSVPDYPPTRRLPTSHLHQSWTLSSRWQTPSSSTPYMPNSCLHIQPPLSPMPLYPASARSLPPMPARTRLGTMSPPPSSSPRRHPSMPT